MKAIMLSEFGDENVMTLAEVPDLPAPEGDSVRIKVAAAGVNRADLLQRQGHYPPPAGESDILGLEVSGTIDALGPDGPTGQAGAHRRVDAAADRDDEAAAAERVVQQPAELGCDRLHLDCSFFQ